MHGSSRHAGSGEHHRSWTASLTPAAQRGAAVRAVADDEQHGVGDAPADARGIEPISTSCPLRRTSRDMHTSDRRDRRDRAVPGSAPGRADSGANRSASTPGGRYSRAAIGPSEAAECAAGIVADVGEHIVRRPDAPQRLPGARQHRPADLVAVHAGDGPHHAVPAQAGASRASGAAAPNQTALA